MIFKQTALSLRKHSNQARRFDEFKVMVNTYRNGGEPAVELVDEYGEAIARLSVNIPEARHLLGKNEFFVNSWSEHEEIVQGALAAGVFRDSGRSSGGFLKAKIWAFR